MGENEVLSVPNNQCKQACDGARSRTLNSKLRTHQWSNVSRFGSW